MSDPTLNINAQATVTANTSQASQAINTVANAAVQAKVAAQSIGSGAAAANQQTQKAMSESVGALARLRASADKATSSIASVANAMMSLNNVGVRGRFALSGDYFDYIQSSITGRIAGLWAVIRGLQSAYDQAVKLDTAFRQLAYLFAPSDMPATAGVESATAIMQTATTVATKYGISLMDVVNVMTEMGRQGKSLDTVAYLATELAEIKTLLISTGNAAVSLSDVMKYGTMIAQQYNLTSEETVDALRKMAALDVSTPAAFERIAQAMQRSAATAKAAGVTYERLVSAATALSAAGYTGEQAGTALNTVLSRVTRNEKALKFFSDLGVSLYETRDGIVRTKDSLALLEEAYGRLSSSVADSSKFQEFSELMAGTRQRSKFLSMLDVLTRNKTAYQEIMSAASSSEFLERSLTAQGVAAEEVSRRVKVLREEEAKRKETLDYLTGSIAANIERMKTMYATFYSSQQTTEFVSSVISGMALMGKSVTDILTFLAQVTTGVKGVQAAFAVMSIFIANLMAKTIGGAFLRVLDVMDKVLEKRAKLTAEGGFKGLANLSLLSGSTATEEQLFGNLTLAIKQANAAVASYNNVKQQMGVAAKALETSAKKELATTPATGSAQIATQAMVNIKTALEKNAEKLAKTTSEVPASVLKTIDAAVLKLVTANVKRVANALSSSKVMANVGVDETLLANTATTLRTAVQEVMVRVSTAYRTLLLKAATKEGLSKSDAVAAVVADTQTEIASLVSRVVRGHTKAVASALTVEASKVTTVGDDTGVLSKKAKEIHSKVLSVILASVATMEAALTSQPVTSMRGSATDMATRISAAIVGYAERVAAALIAQMQKSGSVSKKQLTLAQESIVAGVASGTKLAMREGSQLSGMRSDADSLKITTEAVSKSFVKVTTNVTKAAKAMRDVLEAASSSKTAVTQLTTVTTKLSDSAVLLASHMAKVTAELAQALVNASSLSIQMNNINVGRAAVSASSSVATTGAGAAIQKDQQLAAAAASITNEQLEAQSILLARVESNATSKLTKTQAAVVAIEAEAVATQTATAALQQQTIATNTNVASMDKRIAALIAAKTTAEITFISMTQAADLAEPAIHGVNTAIANLDRAFASVKAPSKEFENQVTRTREQLIGLRNDLQGALTAVAQGGKVPVREFQNLATSVTEASLASNAFSAMVGTKMSTALTVLRGALDKARTAVMAFSSALSAVFMAKFLYDLAKMAFHLDSATESVDKLIDKFKNTRAIVDSQVAANQKVAQSYADALSASADHAIALSNQLLEIVNLPSSSTQSLGQFFTNLQNNLVSLYDTALAKGEALDVAGALRTAINKATGDPALQRAFTEALDKLLTTETPLVTARVDLDVTTAVDSQNKLREASVSTIEQIKVVNEELRKEIARLTKEQTDMSVESMTVTKKLGKSLGDVEFPVENSQLYVKTISELGAAISKATAELNSNEQAMQVLGGTASKVELNLRNLKDALDSFAAVERKGNIAAYTKYIQKIAQISADNVAASTLLQEQNEALAADILQNKLQRLIDQEKELTEAQRAGVIEAEAQVKLDNLRSEIVSTTADIARNELQSRIAGHKASVKQAEADKDILSNLRKRRDEQLELLEITYLQQKRYEEMDSPKMLLERKRIQEQYLQVLDRTNVGAKKLASLELERAKTKREILETDKKLYELQKALNDAVAEYEINRIVEEYDRLRDVLTDTQKSAFFKKMTEDVERLRLEYERLLALLGSEDMTTERARQEWLNAERTTSLKISDASIGSYNYEAQIQSQNRLVQAIDGLRKTFLDSYGESQFTTPSSAMTAFTTIMQENLMQLVTEIKKIREDDSISGSPDRAQTAYSNLVNNAKETLDTLMDLFQKSMDTMENAFPDPRKREEFIQRITDVVTMFDEAIADIPLDDTLRDALTNVRNFLSEFVQGIKEATEEIFASTRDAIYESMQGGFEIGVNYGLTADGFEEFRKHLGTMIARKIGDAIMKVLSEELAKVFNESLFQPLTDSLKSMLGSTLGNMLGGLISSILLGVFSSIIGFIIGGVLADIFGLIEEQQQEQAKDQLNASNQSWEYSDSERTTPYYEFAPPVTNESVKIVKFNTTFNITTDAALAMTGNRRELERIIEEILTQWNRNVAKTVGARI